VVRLSRDAGERIAARSWNRRALASPLRRDLQPSVSCRNLDAFRIPRFGSQPIAVRIPRSREFTRMLGAELAQLRVQRKPRAALAVGRRRSRRVDRFACLSASCVRGSAGAIGRQLLLVRSGLRLFERRQGARELFLTRLNLGVRLPMKLLHSALVFCRELSAWTFKPFVS
jgi:hypothetical protein